MSPFRRGDRLGRYELLCPLATGGMALVWLAERRAETGETDLVVVKTILPEYSQDHRFQKMFLDEANIASRIRHPNVAGIFEVGEEQGNYYIAMEWVDGESLARLHRSAQSTRERVPLGIVLRIGIDLCAGLEAAHGLIDEHGRSLGVVHRDISPQNILIGPTGEAKLIDFGVAKARDRVAQQTEAGQLKGKLRYMPPEQALGRSDIDGRADLWSVGCVLYELLTDNVPFDGPNEVAVLHKLTSGGVGTPLPETVPGPVRLLLEKALAPDREARFATAEQFRVALQQAMAALKFSTSYSEVAHYAAQRLQGRRTTRRGQIETLLRERGLVRPIASPALTVDAASSPGQRTLGSAVIDAKQSPRANRSRVWMSFVGAGAVALTFGAIAMSALSRGEKPATSHPPAPMITARPLESAGDDGLGYSPAASDTRLLEIDPLTGLPRLGTPILAPIQAPLNEQPSVATGAFPEPALTTSVSPPAPAPRAHPPVAPQQRPAAPQQRPAAPQPQPSKKKNDAWAITG